MSRTVKSIVDELLERIRQEGGVVTTTDFATEIVSHSQRIINAGVRSVVGSAVLTTLAEKLIYRYRDELTSSVDVLSVAEGNRELLRFNSLADLTAYDPDWFRAITGTRFEGWCQIGRGLLVVYPGKAAASAVTVTYSTLTTAYTSYSSDGATNVDLPDEDVEMLVGVAEVMLLVRLREFDLLTKRLEVLSETFKAHFEGDK